MNHSEEVSAGENDQLRSAQRLSEYTAKEDAKAPKEIQHEEFETSALGELSGSLAKFHRAPSKRRIILK